MMPLFSLSSPRGALERVAGARRRTWTTGSAEHVYRSYHLSLPARPDRGASRLIEPSARFDRQGTILFHRYGKHIQSIEEVAGPGTYWYICGVLSVPYRINVNRGSSGHRMVRASAQELTTSSSQERTKAATTSQFRVSIEWRPAKRKLPEVHGLMVPRSLRLSRLIAAWQCSHIAHNLSSTLRKCVSDHLNAYNRYMRRSATCLQTRYIRLCVWTLSGE